MPFTSRGREYSGIEVGLASGMIRPGSGRLRKLRRYLAADAISANKRRQTQAKTPVRAATRQPPRGQPAKMTSIEQERQRRKMVRMGLLKTK